MNTYYLRIEAVNLDHFVYDTQDLSTIRGGSLLLRDAVVRRLPAQFPDLVEVSIGASAGLFRFESAEPQAVRMQLCNWLASEPALRHATFVVDVTKAPRNFVLARERLIAMNRFRQMQQLSLVMPERTVSAATGCFVDTLRPGVHLEMEDETETWLSQSTWSRRKFGREQKRAFYEQEAGIQWEMAENARPVVWDFEELTGDPFQGDLHHKLALIYVDGNGFGKIQEALCTTESAQREFDKVVRELRTNLLAAFVNSIKGQRHWMTDEGRYRIETLLWGGDEIVWVVPAWQGWNALLLFYEHTRNWKFRETRLTHSAGIVFAGKSSPIQRVRALAERLAGLAKQRSRNENFFAYQVLESFDYVDEDLALLLKNRYPTVKNPTDWALAATDMPTIASAMSELRDDELLSHSKLHQLAYGTPDEICAIEDELSSDKNKAEAMRKLKTTLRDGRWQHVAELWNYVPAKAEK